MSPIRVLPDTATVSRLIDHRLGGWNCNFIKDIFHQDEAEVIASIPLSPFYPPDRLTWLGTTDGLFTVRSAYHMGMKIQARSHGSTSRASSGQRIWSCIWSLPVQNQVKIFLWRACNNLLPTRCNLALRKIVEDNICPCCKREAETTLHVIWNCLAA